jgi:type IV pilus assembly protein PilB
MTNNIRSTAKEDNLIVNLVNETLAKAIEDRASYLYFEPQAKSLQMRIRRDGILQTILPSLPQKMVTPTIEQLKSMAQIELDLPAPQTGIIYHASKFGQVRLEITTLPTQFGDSVTAKIAYVERQLLSLNQLIPNRESLASIQQLIHCDRGLILIIGAQSSGKSTTVYASLSELNQLDHNIYAVDRQLKYTVPGVNQITLPANANDEIVTTTIQSCLQQYPDIIAIGSIDRLPIALAALQAVSRGCLVFATMQAETAGEAITKLIDLGISAQQLYAATIGIIARRSIERVCPQCRLPYQPDSLELSRLGSKAIDPNELRSYYRANSLTLSEIEQAQQSGELCPKCQGLGYRGRIGLHEVLVITDRLKAAILDGDAEQIDRVARETGMQSFLDLAIKLLRAGNTTLAETQRCIPPRILLQNQLLKKDNIVGGASPTQQNQPDPQALNATNPESLETAAYWKQQAENTKSDYEQLLNELENYRQEVDHFEQQIKQTRLQAEYDTRTEIALQFLSVMDVIELARTSIKPQTDREVAIQKGYSMLENKIMSSIKDIGLRVTESKGHRFNHHFHELIQEVSTHEHPPGIIIEEIRRGYTLGDRVLRLAQVNVAVASSFE